MRNFLTKKALADKYSVSIRTVDRIYKEMSEDRSYVDSIRWIGGRVRIEENAFDMAVRNRR